MNFDFSDFPIFGNLVFQIWEIGEIIENIWKNKGGVKIPLSEAELSFGTPKGVITARKKYHSTKTNVCFDIFRIFGFLDFEILVFLKFLVFRKSDQPLLEENE